jgi:putative aldouronate transport system substrate-binding protein
MKKLGLVFVLLLCGGLLFASGSQPEGEPERDKVVVMTWENEEPNYSILGPQPIIEYVEEKLNIEIEWQLFPHAERSTAINLMIAAGGEMPDLFVAFLSADVTPRTLAEKGVITPWSDLMDEGKMPLAKAKMDSAYMSGVKNQMIDDETGKIYALPYTNFNPLMIWTDYVRGDWLEKLGLEVPETMDEYRDMLRAFKNSDPNGNGKADEIPWQNFYEGVTWMKMWARNFGLPTPDYSLSTVDTLYWASVDKEEIVFAPTHPRFKAMLEYLNSLWAEGLINQEQFNMTSPKFTATISDNTLGTQNMWPSAIQGMQEQLRKIEPGAVWKAMPYAIDSRFMTPDDRVYAFIGPVHQSWLLSKKGKGTEAAIRLMDYIFGDPDFPFINEFGIEGIHHSVGADGKPYYIGEWAEMDSMTRDSAMGSVFGHLAYEKRNIAVRDEIESSEKYADHRAYIADIEKYIKPATLWKLSAEQKDIAKEALKEIRTYVDESITKFVIGAKPFSEWDAYVDTVNKEAGEEIEVARQMYQDYFDEYVKAYY